MARKSNKTQDTGSDLSDLEAPKQETGGGTTIEEVVAMLLAQRGGLGAQAPVDEDRILKLPPNFRPSARPTKTEPMFSGEGLVDEYGNVLKNRDGTVKAKYNDADILGWYNLPFSVRKRYGDLFKKMGLYGRGSPSATYDQDNDLAVFATVLNTANIEGRTWKAALPIIEKRIKSSMPTGGTGKSRYKPSSAADIESVLQTEAREQLGRQLSTTEAQPLAARIQRQETRQQTTEIPEQPTATRTLIQSGVQKQFGAEADAYRAAQFIGKILKGD